MICYKDKTFCSARDCAKFAECDRALTHAVMVGAKKIGLPLAVCGTFSCFEPTQSWKESSSAQQDSNICQADPQCSGPARGS